MQLNRSSRLNLALALVLYTIIEAPIVLAQSSVTTPVNFKIAFIGDQGVGDEARSVLNLIKAEGAQAVLHLGDLDYEDDPAAWEAQINGVFGANFPYFACIGNHDEKKWAGADGYQTYLQDRLNRLGIAWEGDLGVKSSLRYKGIFIVLTAPGIMGSGHDAYIRDMLAADNSVWSIAGWHMNMRLMQVGDKSDDTGWGVYEEARKGGAIIATAHEHSYSRTYLLSSVINQTVASRSDPFILTKGETFVFVSGLGGKSVRSQELAGDCWATIYTSNQDGTYGALFGVFSVNGVGNLANFYFKNTAGGIVDHFAVISQVEDGGTDNDPPDDDSAGADTTGADTTGADTGVVFDFILEQNYPNPFFGLGRPATIIRFHLMQPARTRLTIFNLMGETVRVLFEGEASAGRHSMSWDGRDDAGRNVPSGIYLYRLESDHQIVTRKLLMLR